jgi:predicted dehydrogenase
MSAGGYAEPGVGLVSVGWMGQLHSRAYRALPQVYPGLAIRPRLVHAADTAADRAGYARDVLGYDRVSPDYRDVLADPEVDVVSICAPNALHREIGVAAARAGKPFWIEKPVGRDAAETAAVAAAARAAGVTTSIGYNYRHVPAVERVRELIAAGELGRITNVRAVFLNSYASDPRGALSWRFRRDLAGSGALGDLLSHVVDLMQYVVAPITEVTGRLTAVHARRPVAPAGGTHFAVVQDGERPAELGDVENDDYAAALVRFAGPAGADGAVGTLEASRVAVGPQCGLSFEIYGTDGSAAWNFERMSEFRLCLSRGGPDHGYTTVLGNAALGDYAAFQPGPGHNMSYDDLKVIEAKKFLVAVGGGEQRNSTIEDAHADAEVLAAVAASAADGAWHPVAAVPGATFGRAARHPAAAAPGRAPDEAAALPARGLPGRAPPVRPPPVRQERDPACD